MQNSDSALTELFSAALEIDSVDRRVKFLDDACRENPKLRKQLDKLLEFECWGSISSRRGSLELVDLMPQCVHLTPPAQSSLVEV